MGRTIKISELKKFDVCLINGKPYMFTDYAYDGYLFLEVGGNNESWDNEDTLPETELLGRMEFKPEEIIAKHICDSRCLDDDNGHHAWPSP